MDELEKIQQRVTSPSLTINRLPRPTFDAFKLLAEEQFEGNYGFTLKFLMDGVVNMKETEVMVRLDALETAFEELRQKLSQPEVKPRKTLAGREVTK